MRLSAEDQTEEDGPLPTPSCAQAQARALSFEPPRRPRRLLILERFRRECSHHRQGWISRTRMTEVGFTLEGAGDNEQGEWRDDVRVCVRVSVRALV